MTTEHGRESLLRAGAALIERASAAVSLRGLTVRALVKEAGLSSGAFYHYWDTQADYVRDLTSMLLRPDVIVGANPVVDAAEDTMTRPTVAALTELFDGHCTEQSDSAELRNQMFFWSMADADEAMAGLREVYASWQSTFSGLYEQMFVPLGVTVRAGVTFDDLAIVVSALADGMAFRRRFDPDAASSRLARASIVALLSSLLVRDDAASIDDVADRLDALLANRLASASDLVG